MIFQCATSPRSLRIGTPDRNSSDTPPPYGVAFRWSTRAPRSTDAHRCRSSRIASGAIPRYALSDRGPTSTSSSIVAVSSLRGGRRCRANSRRNQEVASHAKRCIGPGNRSRAVLYGACECADSVHGFRHDDGFVEHLVGIDSLAALHRKHVLPQRYFPEIATWPSQVAHQFHGAVERDDPVVHAHEGNPRRRSESVENLIPIHWTDQFNNPVVEVTLRVSSFRRGGDH